MKTPDTEVLLVRVIAGETMADPRTVLRALRGLPVRGATGQRIREAIARYRAEAK